MKKRPQFPVRFFLLAAVLFFLAGPAVLRAGVTHTVKPGESLWAIGKKYRLNPEEIRAANRLSGATIRAGQKLVIPGGEAKKELSAAPKAPRSEGEAAEALKPPRVHKVRKGETLASIARKYGLGAEELKEINELKGSKLKAGQAIRLRPEEEDEDSGAEPNAPGQAPAEKAEPAPVFIQGNGFLLGDKSRELLGRVAKSFLGFRYTKGGGSINGMDCSSYVQRVYQIFGIDLPRTAREQFRMGYTVAKNTLQVGDLVFFKRQKSPEPTHVGIYLGENKYIHTSLTKRQVEIDSLDGRYANLHFAGAKRIEEFEAKMEKRDSEGD